MSKAIEFIPSENSWDKEIEYEKYGFEVYQVKMDGRLTDFKAIYRKDTGKIVAMPRNNYKLLPNEVVLGMANKVANDMNLKPFRVVAESIDDWRTFKGKSKYKKSKKEGYTMVQEMEGAEHAIMDGDATRMYAFYTLPHVKMDSKEELNFGVCVMNSIDTTQSLAILGFSYRFICQNMSLATLKQIAVKGKLEGLYKRHTKNLDISPKNIKIHMEKAASSVVNLQNIYGKWMVEDVPKETVRKVGKGIPVKYLPEYIQKDGNKTTLTLEPTPTTWKVYNDLTESIWHEPVALKTKQSLFESLHDAFGL